MYKYVIMKVSQKGKVTDRRTYTLTHTELLLDLLSEVKRVLNCPRKFLNAGE